MDPPRLSPFVVPTTTPPLVWPSNGKNKGAPTKIFESYTYGGIDM